MQVASSSRGTRGPSSSRGGGSAGNTTTTHVPTGGARRNEGTPRAQERRVAIDVAPHTIAVREGERPPEGYTLAVRAPATPSSAPKAVEMVDLSTPPAAATLVPTEDVEASKGKAAERRNVTRKLNREAHAELEKELKDSVAGGRLPTLKVSESPAHLKARWHAAAKECAYKLLDMTKESWRSYTFFEKGLVHNELKDAYKFDPPLDPKRTDKYLAGHLRSARATWKAHWLQHGDENRHPNCPEVAWEKLILWWRTSECRDEAAAMAERRSRVRNGSKSGRKGIVDRMDEQVSAIRFELLCSVMQTGRFTRHSTG